MRKEVSKVLIKIRDQASREYKWIHLGYIPKLLHEQYFREGYRTAEYLKYKIIQWAKEDFGVNVKLHTIEQVLEFKQFILNAYKQEYQDLFPKDGISFSKAGWFVLWLTKHMEMELEETHA